ncbi:hypothetical protein [Marinomonas sp. 2405UD68-3]|uniref:hypothetical protein n=1 Tax=Marinomonas sp. 2405UD68-3 TaxID=3391835 RepID=UPI0039C95F83
MDLIIRSAIHTICFIFLCTVNLSNANDFKLDKTRISFDEKDRRQEFRIYNDSNELQSFRVTLTEMKMHKAGHLESVVDYPLSAKKYLRVGPRISRNIPAKSFAKIRLIKKEVNDIGEFRSHIVVESIKTEAEKKSSGISIQPNIKYVIPVFIRNYSSERKAKVTLKKHRYDNENLSLLFSRNGIGSFSGNLVIQDEKGNELYRANQVSIYPELNQREFRTNIKRNSFSGSLTIIMEGLDDSSEIQYETHI